MDRTSRLIDAVCETSWAMKRDVLDNLVAVVRRHDMGVRLTAEDVLAVMHPRNLLAGEQLAAAGGGASGSEPYQLNGSVAVVSIGGVIAKYASNVGGVSQPRGTSLEAIKKATQVALDNEAVGSVLYLIDSPGGSVSGLWQAMDDIRQMATVKPVWAFIDGLGASAAYGIASQAQRIYASAGLTVGSIGVFTVMVDASRAAANEGYEIRIIASGDKKGVGAAMGAPISEAQWGKVQEEINALAEELVTRVPLGRKNLSLDQVRALADGSVWIGAAAVKNGLIDGNKPVGEVLAEMNRLYKPSKASGRVAPVMGGGAGGARAEAGTVVGTSAGDTGQEQVMKPENLQNAAGASPADGDVAGKITPDQANAYRAEGQKAEAARVASITALGSRFAHVNGVKEKVTAAIADPNTTLASFQTTLMDTVAEGSKPLGAVGAITVGDEGFRRKVNAMSTVLVHRANGGLRDTLSGGGEKAEKIANALGYAAGNGISAAGVALAEYRAAESAGIRGMRLPDMARACVGAMDPQAVAGLAYGDDVGLFRKATQRGAMASAGHSTSDFPTILANVANKTLIVNQMETPVTWDQWAAESIATDYKPASTVSLSDAQDLKLIIEGDAAKKVTFNERGSTIQVRPYALKFGMTYQMMRNDDVSAFTQIPGLFGVAAARLPEILVYQLLETASGVGPTMEYDSKAMIHTDHRNLLAATALGYAALQLAVTAMQTQRGFGADTTILNIQPHFVIVPPALRFAADLIFKNQYAPGTTADANLLQSLLRPVVAPRLTASATRYWLAGPKSNSSVEVRFLDGQRTPRIDMIENGNPLEQEMQATLMGVGVAARNHENISSSAGG